MALILDMRWKFQSTPPRGGRRHCDWTDYKVRVVSIHAPARGATRMRPARPRLHEFQSTPPRGGRPTWSPWRPSPGGFNPRPRAGGDATLCRSCTAGSCFNPRPRAGGDSASRSAPARSRFQSTPPRGGRRQGLPRELRSRSFNPRPRAGGDRDSPSLFDSVAFCTCGANPSARRGCHREELQAPQASGLSDQGLTGSANLQRETLGASGSRRDPSPGNGSAGEVPGGGAQAEARLRAIFPA